MWALPRKMLASPWRETILRFHLQNTVITTIITLIIGTGDFKVHLCHQEQDTKSTVTTIAHRHHLICTEDLRLSCQTQIVVTMVISVTGCGVLISSKHNGIVPLVFTVDRFQAMSLSFISYSFSD